MPQTQPRLQTVTVEPSGLPQGHRSVTQKMLAARQMLNQMTDQLRAQADGFALTEANADKLTLLSSAPAQSILEERLARLLDLDEWNRADQLELASLFLLRAVTQGEGS